MTDAHVLTVEDMRRLDADYRPIEPFDAWADLAPPAAPWDRYVERYEAVRAEASPDVLAAALADVTRAAAFDTGAIEGLYAGDRGITHTVMTQAATWEAYVAQERGWDVVDFVKAHVEAFDMALDLATGGQPITEAWIRRVHEVVCAPQDAYEVTTPVGRQRHALPKGEYKRQSNHVLQPDGTPFAYAPVDQVRSEMARLVDAVRQARFETAHPATQAAYLHHAFVRVHPFADGNGRVARVLASVPLLRALSVPLVVFADERSHYLQALTNADRGHRAALVGFVADRVVDTVALVGQTLDLHGEDAIDHARRTLTAFRGRSDDELLPLADRILADVVAEWLRQVAAADLPGVTGQAAQATDPSGAGSEFFGRDYRAITGGPKIVVVSITLDVPRPASMADQVAIGVARSADEPFLFRVGRQFDESKQRRVGTLDARRSEVDPATTTSFRMRMTAWVRRLVEVQVQELVRQLA